MIFADNPAFAPWGIATCVVALHLLLLAHATGFVRIAKKQYVNPEDAALAGKPRAEGEHPTVLRIGAAHRNLLENAVPFFPVALLYLLTGASRTGMIAYTATFVGARVVHSIAFIWSLQPWRTLSFNVGALATLGMAVHVLRTLF